MQFKMRIDKQRLCVYRDVVACGEKPVADKVKAGYNGAKVNPVGFREKVDSREQFISDAVKGVLEVGLGLTRGATQHTLRKWVTHKHVRKKAHKPTIKQVYSHKSKKLFCHHFLHSAFSSK